MTVFREGRIFTHADPTRGLCARPRRPSHALGSHGAGDASDNRPILGFWGSWGEKIPKMGDSLTGMPMNHRAVFDAAIALSSAEKSVTVQTNKRTKKQHKQ